MTTFPSVYGGSCWDKVSNVDDCLVRAERGNSSAQYNLGVLYDNGRGVRKDYKEAVKWYRKAAEQGLAGAQNNLGVLYDNGQGVRKDYKEAVKWYRKSAEQGYSKAQSNLGMMYAKGKGVLQDYKEAVKWYRKSAEQGYSPSHYLLGVMYHNGTGVPKDYVMTLMYWNLASVNKGNNRYNLEKKMTLSQIKKAQELSIEWIRKRNNTSVIPIHIHEVISSNRILSNVDEKSQSINRCSELFIKNLEKDKSWKLYKINDSGQCISFQHGVNCGYAVATGVCAELTYEKSKYTELIKHTDNLTSEVAIYFLEDLITDRLIEPFLESLFK